MPQHRNDPHGNNPRGNDRKDPRGKDQKTLTRINAAAKEEFLEKGFRDASLRQIVKKAGVTTGSFYWYYHSKEELFAAIVKPHYDHILDLYEEACQAFWKLPLNEQRDHPGEIGRHCMAEMVGYCYQHPAEFRILFRGASGTKYADLIDTLARREVETTHQFLEQLRESCPGAAPAAMPVSPEIEHILTTGLFDAMAELIIHDIPAEKAKVCVRELHDFYSAGWTGLLSGAE